MNGMKKLSAVPSDHVLVFGMGPIVLKLHGLKNPAVCKMNELRRKKALDCGADSNRRPNCSLAVAFAAGIDEPHSAHAVLD